MIENSQQWLPIVTAPRDGTLIDVWFDGERFTDVYWGRPAAFMLEEDYPEHPAWVCAGSNDFLTGEKGWLDGEPTHWMPVPAPPRVS